MSSKYLAFTLILALVGFANSDIENDKKQCTNQLIGLSACLFYVGGNAEAPTQVCCTNVKQVVKSTMICLCILIKDKDDPTLGLNYINVTLALRLPATCNAPVDLSQCPVLLHLAPNSAEAKLFDDFDNSLKGSNSTPASNGNSTSKVSNGEIKSEGGRGKRWLMVELICVIMSYMILHV